MIMFMNIVRGKFKNCYIVNQIKIATIIRINVNAVYCFSYTSLFLKVLYT